MAFEFGLLNWAALHEGDSSQQSEEQKARNLNSKTESLLAF